MEKLTHFTTILLTIFFTLQIDKIVKAAKKKNSGKFKINLLVLAFMIVIAAIVVYLEVK